MEKSFTYFLNSHELFLDVFKRILLEKCRLALETIHIINKLIAPIWMPHHECLYASQAKTNYRIFWQSLPSSSIPSLLSSVHVSCMYSIRYFADVHKTFHSNQDWNYEAITISNANFNKFFENLVLKYYWRNNENNQCLLKSFFTQEKT